MRPAGGSHSEIVSKSCLSYLIQGRELLRLLLLLLANADLEVRLFGLLVRFMIVPGHGVAQIGIDIGVFGQHRHHREILIAGGAERPETLHIRDCHTLLL